MFQRVARLRFQAVRAGQRTALITLIHARSWVTTLFEVTGLGLIVAAFFRISETSGLIAAGVALFAVGVLAA